MGAADVARSERLGEAVQEEAALAFGGIEQAEEAVESPGSPSVTWW